MALLEKYEKLIFSICYQNTGQYFDAEDLTQETFLAAYKHLGAFDGEHEKAWLVRIATNKCLDYIKCAGRRIQPVEDGKLFAHMELLAKGTGTDSPEQIVLESQVRERFYRLCRRLKPPDDEIAYAYFAKGETAQEIALAKGMKLKTVQTKISRSRKKLQGMWREEEKDAYSG